MTAMQLFIRVEGNPNIGLGHVMRCYAFAESCQANNISVSFLCSQETSDFLKSRHTFASSIIVIEGALQTKADNINSLSKELAASLVKYAPDILNKNSILLLDGYQFNHAYQKTLVELGVRVAYFDDINSFYLQESNNNSQSSHHSNLQHPADVIINGSESAFNLHYDDNARQSKLCLGNDYLLLRREFHHLWPVPLHERPSLLINFGGADVNNYSTRLLLALHQAGFSSPVRLVSGAAFQHSESLEACLNNELKTSLMPVQHIHDAQEMASLMQHSRLAVCAAGGTQFELLACATPSILVVVADNQLPATQHAVQQGWCDMCDWQDDADIEGLAKQVVSLWKDEKDLQLKFLKATQQQEKLTFDGAENILNVLSELAH
jgi:UDP-2,4-diacetamido-2,4,6-trideoxy-beta-L-altropyranose hydrolase